MAGDGVAGVAGDGADQDVDLGDDSGAEIAAVGRQIRLWREAAGLRAVELGAAIGYGENQVYKVEAGKRIPKPEFLDKADEVLGAGGKLAAMKKDVAEARYPKKIRDLTNLEHHAVEIAAYDNHNIHGLLQTEEYARALFEMRRPAYLEDQINGLVAARMARQAILSQRLPPALAFVVEEAVLRRPLGGADVLRRQLERLLEVGRLRHAEIQVMPLDREDHAGMGGPINLLKLRDGGTIGYSEAQLTSRVVSDPKELQVLELRHGIIRAQALTPRESLAFIEKMRGEA